MTDHDATLLAIAQRRRVFADTLFNRDHDALPELFTEDTLLLPSGGPYVQGREAVVAFWTEATRDPGKQSRGQFDAIDSIVLGDLVIESGRALVTRLEAGREVGVNPGKYIVVWKREAGRWKRHRDIFNSDTPSR